jgi:ketosteroid isomerase-like protein
MSDDDEKAVAVVTGAYEAISEGGPELLLDRYDEFFAPDFTFHPALVGTIESRTYVGRDAFADYWRDFTGVLADPVFSEPEYEPVGGDRVLVTTRLQAQGAGSGVPIDRRVAQLFEVRDGRMVSGRTFFSPDDARTFLEHEVTT